MRILTVEMYHSFKKNKAEVTFKTPTKASFRTIEPGCCIPYREYLN